MQRPRRTSEFFEETSAASSTRKSRTTQRLPSTPSTIKKYSSTRRTTTRNSSFDRGLAAPSASRGTTPSRPHSASRSLFPSSTVGSGNLHNDKKWVQEQTQRITEHLKRAAVLGYGYLDFINHNGLRHMSIKQFVAVVNYFLHFIAGTRLSVGTNHVEDIVNVLQNIQYPYAINKSWLKTPNTQHSFGNVVMLLSWLLDFVPPMGEEVDLECFFPLQDNQDIKSSADAPSFIADADFHLQMMQHCEEGFTLWNNELMKEYVDLQQKTCDLYISKRTNFSTANALERNIQQLTNQLESLKEKCIPVSKSDVEHQQQLLEERQNLLQRQKSMHNELKHLSENIKTLGHKYENCYDEVKQLEQEVAQLRHKIEQQKYTAAERDAFIDQVDILTHTKQSQERTLGELQDQNYRKQVELSRLKKKQTDDIQQFNAHMRALNEIVIDTQATTVDCSHLQLPLNVEPEQLANIIDLLVKINEEILRKSNEFKNNVDIMSRKLEQNEERIFHNIQREYEMSSVKLLLTEKTLKQQETQQQVHLEDLIKRHQELKMQLNQIEITVAQLNASNAQKKQQLQSKQHINSSIMLETEKIHEMQARQHEEHLIKFEKQLDENIAELLKLKELALENEEIFKLSK